MTDLERIDLVPGVLQVRRNLLAGVASDALFRTALAARQEAERQRDRVAGGRLAPDHAVRTADIAATLESGATAVHGLAVQIREAEIRDTIQAARSGGEPTDTFVHIGEAVGRVVVATPETINGREA